MRVIAVGDDDQNIYEFRGSCSDYMKSLITDYGARRYEMLENYRSGQTIVAMANVFSQTIRRRMKSEPICAVTDQPGKVVLTKYKTNNMETPLVAQLIANKDCGTRCILAATNDEALRIMGLLTRSGVPAKLIQSNDDFDPYNLAEMRFFLKQLGDSEFSRTVDEECWNNGKKKLADFYAGSANLPLCMKILDTFAAVNKKLFRSDFVEFLHESKVEHFIYEPGETVLVSTIHKAKGHEFDNVYIMLNGYDFSSDADKRAVYVGMTRAKNTLYIHTNTTFFDRFSLPSVERRVDAAAYDEPEEIMLQLTHRDVYLDYFKLRQKQNIGLRSGDALSLDGSGLKTVGKHSCCAVKLSQACRERLAGLAEKGYKVDRAAVRFTGFWKGQDDEEETLIVLPELYLRRQ